MLSNSRSSVITIEKLKGYAYVVYPSTVPTFNSRCSQTSSSVTSSQQSLPENSVPVDISGPRETLASVGPRVGIAKAGTFKERKAGITEATAVTIESSDDEANFEFETRAAHVFVGDKSLGSCTVTWPPLFPDQQGTIVIKTHGSEYSTKSTTILVPASEVTTWYLRETATGPLALVIRTAAGGELGRRFKDHYEPGTDWLLMVLVRTADVSGARAKNIAQLRRRLGPMMHLEEFVPMAPSSPAAADDPDAPVVVQGPGAAEFATSVAAENTIEDPVSEAIGSLSMHWQHEILATLEIKTSPCRSARRYPPPIPTLTPHFSFSFFKFTHPHASVRKRTHAHTHTHTHTHTSACIFIKQLTPL